MTERARTAVDRRRRRLVVMRAIGVVCVALGTIVVLVVAVLWPVLHRYYERTQDGLDPYPARIVTIRADDSDTDDGVVVVRYGGPDGLTSTIRVHDVDDWVGKRRVTMLFDPATNVVTLPGENFLPEEFAGSIAMGFTLAAVLLLVGTTLWARSAMFLHRRSRSPWRTGDGAVIKHRSARCS